LFYSELIEEQIKESHSTVHHLCSAALRGWSSFVITLTHHVAKWFQDRKDSDGAGGADGSADV